MLAEEWFFRNFDDAFTTPTVSWSWSGVLILYDDVNVVDVVLIGRKVHSNPPVLLYPFNLKERTNVYHGGG